LPGGLENLVAVEGDQCLVGGDHMLAVVDGFEHQLPGYGGAADQLNHYIHGRIAGHRENILSDIDVAGITNRVNPPCRHLDNLDIGPGACINKSGVAGQHIKSTTTHGAETADTNIYRFQAHHPGLKIKDGNLNGGLCWCQWSGALHALR